jgi:PKD repeat protein
MATRSTGGRYFHGDVQADTFNAVEVYAALLTQASTSAPVATVLRNDLDGTVVWAYSAPGIYTATLTGAFLANKTTVKLGTVKAKLISAVTGSTSVITVRTTDTADSDANAILLATPIEIKVYNA